MHYPRAPSSPPPTTTHHHPQEQTMHYSSSSPAALSPARPERLRGHKAGHRRDNGVPSRDLAAAAYEDVTGTSRGRHRHLGPACYGAECGCFVALRTVREYQAGACSACNLCDLVRANPVRRSPAATSVPARRVRDHLDALIASGWTIATLAEHVGYGPSTLYAIRSGRWQFTSRLIAEDILSVPVKEVAA